MSQCPCSSCTALRYFPPAYKRQLSFRKPLWCLPSGNLPAPVKPVYSPLTGWRYTPCSLPRRYQHLQAPPADMCDIVHTVNAEWLVRGGQSSHLSNSHLIHWPLVSLLRSRRINPASEDEPCRPAADLGLTRRTFPRIGRLQ